ncbi:HAD-like domain-containing protein, partial [Mycena pura]
MGGFVGEVSPPEWEAPSGTQQRPASTMGHVRAKSSLGNKASLLGGTRAAAMYSRPSSHPFSVDDNSELFQPTAKSIDDARIRKFAEEQARLERVHTPNPPASDEAITLRKFAEEQARLHRAHSPETSRTEAQIKFAEEQARLQRAFTPELPRNEPQAKSGTSPDASRKAAQTPTAAADSARLAAFAEQQQRAQAQLAQDLRSSSASRLGQNAQTLRGKPASTVAGFGSAGARRSIPGASQSMFNRFPLNERDDGKSSHSEDSSLTKVEVLFFDLDGTVLNWQGTVADELRRLGNKYFPEFDEVDWEGFAMKWREMYLAAIRDLAQHGNSLAPSTVYRTTLDQLLNKEGAELAARWTPPVRSQLVDVWNRLQPWPDTRDGLKAIKTIKTVATLSNESLRTQTQINRHAGLSWDICLSGSLLGSYRGTPDTYLEAAHSMTLPPANCAVVSAHADELRVARSAGMRTIYVRRASEENLKDGGDAVRCRLEGGEVDLVVDSFEHLASALGCD